MKIREENFPAEKLQECFDYNPETGQLFWKFVESNRVYVGKEAAKISGPYGYKTVTLKGKSYRAHRLIWALVTGEWPKDFIDHIDRDRSNNKFTNLRVCTQKQNNINKTPSKNFSSPYLGVCKPRGRKLWLAQLQQDGRCRFLGYFSSEVDAAKAYDLAAKEVFGGFAVLNFKEENA